REPQPQGREAIDFSHPGIQNVNLKGERTSCRRVPITPNPAGERGQWSRPADCPRGPKGQAAQPRHSRFPSLRATWGQHEPHRRRAGWAAARAAYRRALRGRWVRSEEHTSELQSPYDLVCRLLLEKK